MKTSRVLIIVAVIVVIALVALYAAESSLSHSPTSAEWSAAAKYPLEVGGVAGVAGQQCVASGSYVYCVGGEDVNGGPRNEVYVSSSLSSSANITGWTLSTSAYPQSINGQACAAYGGYLYCVGGSYDDSGDDVASSYYAPLGAGGTVGTWTSTTAYPIAIDSQECVASSGYIFCIGGSNETDGMNDDATSSNSVWYAQVSASGVGAWMQTTAYPSNLFYPSCYASSGYVFCIGGADSGDNPESTSYYAVLTASGVGQWTKTESYPLSGSGIACGVSSGTMYCVGAEQEEGSYSSAAYYATVSSSGIGSWKASSSYPVSAETTCVASSSDLYCVGGFDGSSAGESASTYYASLSSLSTATTS